MTKVDFDSLDRLTIKPLGIYGTRSKIIEYLYDKGVLSDPMYVCRSVSLRLRLMCVFAALLCLILALMILVLVSGPVSISSDWMESLSFL